MLSSLFKRLLALLSRAAAVLIGAVVALLFCVASFSSAYEILGHSRDFQALGMVLLPLYVVFCVVVHEAGHAAAARLCGWKVHLISIVGLAYRPATGQFHRTGREWRARSGFVFATPRDDGAWDRSWAVVVLGGPLANFATAGILYAVMEAVQISPRLTGLMGGIALCSLTMGLANLMPFARGPHRKSDGGHLLDMILGRKLSADMRDAYRVTGLVYDRVPLGSWDAALIARLESAKPDPQFDVTRISALVNYYLVRGDVRRAHANMEGWARSTDVPRTFAPARAFLVAIVERDPDKAEKILESTPEAKRKSSFNYLRTAAIILALRGRDEAARAAAAQARAAARKYAVNLDKDDELIFQSIERGEPVPDDFAREAA
jgi:Zn-dependent protease